MSDVPYEVHREILLRLPAECLFRFRAVCKAWRSIIDDPTFIRSHANNQLSSNTLLIRNKTGAPLYSFSLDSLKFIQDRQKIRVTQIKQLNRRGVPRLPALPVASCNGLILIAHEDIKKIWAVWNPLTRDCRELRQPNAELCLMGSGFGYDYAADDYRVVRIDRLCRQGKLAYQTHVYSLKSDSWRMIADCPSDFPWLSSPGVFLNGALHWRSRDIIIALDVGTENYRKLQLPPIPDRLQLSEIRLDALGGCLILSYYHDTMGRFNGWVMKDYGVEDSWMNLLSFDEQDIVKSVKGLRPVAYLESKGQVFLQYDGGFFWYDVESDSVKKVTIHGLSRISSSQICPGSLFRLNDSGDASGSVVTKKAGAKRKRKMKWAESDTRLTFCVRDTEDWCCSDYSCYSPDSSWSNDDADWYL